MEKKLVEQYKEKKAVVVNEFQELEKSLENRLALSKKISEIDEKISREKENLSLQSCDCSKKNWAIDSSIEKIDAIGLLIEKKELYGKLMAELNIFIDDPEKGKRVSCKKTVVDFGEWKQSIIKKAFDDEWPTFIESVERFFTLFQCGHIQGKSGSQFLYNFDNFFNCILRESNGVFRDELKLESNRGDLYEEFFGDRCGNEATF